MLYLCKDDCGEAVAGGGGGQVLHSFQAVHLETCAQTLRHGVRLHRQVPHLHRQPGPIVPPPRSLLQNQHYLVRSKRMGKVV